MIIEHISKGLMDYDCSKHPFVQGERVTILSSPQMQSSTTISPHYLIKHQNLSLRYDH